MGLELPRPKVVTVDQFMPLQLISAFSALTFIDYKFEKNVESVSSIDEIKQKTFLPTGTWWYILRCFEPLSNHGQH